MTVVMVDTITMTTATTDQTTPATEIPPVPQLSGCGTCAMSGRLTNPVTRRRVECHACRGLGRR